MIGETRLFRISYKLISIFDSSYWKPIISHLLRIIRRIENSMRTFEFYLESKITNHPRADWASIKTDAEAETEFILRPNMYRFDMWNTWIPSLTFLANLLQVIKAIMHHSTKNLLVFESTKVKYISPSFILPYTLINV